MKKEKWNKMGTKVFLITERSFLAFLFLYLLLFIANFIFPLHVSTRYSPIVLASDGSLLHAYLTPDDKWRMYTTLDEITPELKKAIVFKEDRYFYVHPGVNPVSVVRAFIKNTTSGKRTSGASTITMQVARMLEPKERTLKNKYIELFRAFQLELRFSKDEILQLYLNLVPYGSNIEGVKSASVIYFGKMPNHLSIGEIAALSIIPNRPVSLRLGLNNDFIEHERNKWLLRYKKAHLFPDAYIDDAIQEGLQAYRRQIPGKAPHLSYRLKKTYSDRNIIHTSIDPEIQAKCEALVRNYSATLYFQNIKNAATLIIDNKTMQVIAYIGSANFDNNEDGGQVDGVKAVRSPGSTLKPLLYGMAIDAGNLTPKTVISDVPVSFAGYEPENYDDKFYGNITVEDALARSLNVPAVKILAEMGTTSFIDKLSKAGFRQISRNRDQLGLSVILGGCGISLEEITTLYASFANQGSFRPVHYLREDNDTASIRVLSPAADYMVTQILTTIKRPDLPLQWENSMHTPKIAWKTGTSYGRKDAWSIGYNKDYTIGVWVGNFSAEGVPELSGSEKATPLLFQLFNAINYNSKGDWFMPPKELGSRYVCAKTGLEPSEFCSDLIVDDFVPGISSTQKCNHLRKVYINPDSTISYCTSCLPDLGYSDAFFPNLAPEIITFYEQNNIKYLKIPPHNPACERLLSGQAPHIVSPVNENQYFVSRDESTEVMLNCHAANDVEFVFWYINKKFFRKALAGEKIFFMPNEGKVEISCSDDKGRNTNILIDVKYVTF